ncbi:glycerophosphodiester phosphodiesterase [Cohnella massiliensis]|uniref:glycerophosphodiester phosphodiesterase n=1 Tax=Cohnella massiliensis TaxID=1816691 RepID=UPI0011197B6B|nr:glycerophosphodiester phosphodiesterase [Cohnella massiliensis]
MRKREITTLYFYTLHLLLVAAIIALLMSWSASRDVLMELFSPDRKVATIAHRGASGYAPENTLAAYRTAVRMNADYLEIDLQMTKDGHLVAMHDETVNRTTDGTGRVRNLTLEEIRQLDAGSWFNQTHPMYAREEYAGEKVPTLREIFETFGNDANYLLETKSPTVYPGMEEQLIELVEEYKLSRHVAVQSFSKASLSKLRSLNEEILLFQLLWYNAPAYISSSSLEEIKQYANGIGANFEKLSGSYVQKVKNAGLLVYPYTVNYQVNMSKAVRWGADGVHTNYPDRLIEVIEEARHSGIG